MPLSFGGSANGPPLAPAIIGPANAATVTFAAAIPFDWQYRPGTPGGIQSGWAFRRKASGSATFEWFNVQTGAFQSSFVLNTGPTQSFTFDPGTWANGQSYNWSVMTQDQYGTGVYSPTYTVTGQANASVTVLAPAGTIATSRPLITWHPDVAPGAQEQSYRVVLYTQAQYQAAGFVPGGSGPSIYDSGLVLGTAAQLTLPTAVQLTNHATFRVYVQVSQTGGQLSPWSYSTFTTAYTAPAAPTVVVTSSPTPTTTKPVNVVEVQGHDTGTLVGRTTATVRYSDDGGKTWWPVRTGAGVAIPSTNQTVRIIDREAPPGFARMYQARIGA